MTLNSFQKIKKSSEKALYAFFVNKFNRKETIELLKSSLGVNFDLPKTLAEKGASQTLNWNKTSILLLGLGDEKRPDPERLRESVHKAVGAANQQKKEQLFLTFFPDKIEEESYVEAMAEAALLSNYQFLVYKTEKKENSLKSVHIFTTAKSSDQYIQRGQHIAEATMVARDLVNEPVITLTAEELAVRSQALGKKYGFKVDVFNKKKIESLKMGGLLAVNTGSPNPPTFTIMEYKPAKAVNKKPLVLVGKGVVYDTGGLSLKPTANSMDFMKADMGGAAAVIGAMCGVAALQLPVHVIGLVPATDNRPGGNAYTPGDVITMYDGSTVEVLNTDAEGRMILADALAYAKKYDPDLVIDLATLTGAAVVAVGTNAIAMMSTAGKKVNENILDAGEEVYERMVKFPLWDEYGEQLKSDIADRKNIGGRSAGSIVAGKFLQAFTDYPWVHLDIAGPAFLHAPSSYRGKNGTGVGVRALLRAMEKNYQQ